MEDRLKEHIKDILFGNAEEEKSDLPKMDDHFVVLDPIPIEEIQPTPIETKKKYSTDLEKVVSKKREIMANYGLSRKYEAIGKRRRK